MPKEIKNIAENIMNRIRGDKLKMRPKWYFIIGTVLTFLGLAISVVTSVFVVGLIRFALRARGPMSDFRLQQMIADFPWWLSILAVIGLVVGILLIRKYDFSYKVNLKVLILVFVLGVVFSGLLVDSIGINETLSQRGPMKGVIQRRILKNPNFMRPDTTYPNSISPQIHKIPR